MILNCPDAGGTGVGFGVGICCRGTLDGTPVIQHPGDAHNFARPFGKAQDKIKILRAFVPAADPTHSIAQ